MQQSIFLQRGASEGGGGDGEFDALTSQMMKRDCEAAGIDYSNSDGFVDFHANRVLFYY